jgi:hypothetical protein
MCALLFLTATVPYALLAWYHCHRPSLDLGFGRILAIKFSITAIAVIENL